MFVLILGSKERPLLNKRSHKNYRLELIRRNPFLSKTKFMGTATCKWEFTGIVIRVRKKNKIKIKGSHLKLSKAS